MLSFVWLLLLLLRVLLLISMARFVVIAVVVFPDLKDVLMNVSNCFNDIVVVVLLFNLLSLWFSLI